MKTIIFIILGLALACHLPAVPAAVLAQGKIAPEVQAAMASASSTQTIAVIVYLRDRANLGLFNRLPRTGRLMGVIKALRDKAALSQRSLLTLMELRRGQGQAGANKSLWVVNGISLTATPSMIQELAGRADVQRIELDAVDIVPTAVEPNLSVIGIGAPDDVWSQGYYGQGVVVANLDSGVDNTHPDLANRWRGGTNSWYDPYAQHATPFDQSGHGTWTMGIMVGAAASGTSIGVAPGVQWIAAKIFKDNGTATATGIHLAFQWLLDPDGNPATADAPHVVNNSWAFGTPGCNLAFQPDLQALVAVGIVPVFAAGNYGPGSSKSVSPANYPEAVAVGATNNLDQLYAGSSKGPSACGESSTTYPEIMGPGVTITSTDLFGLYTSQTGTSLASPHVAGSLAVLLSAHPELTAAQQRDALLLSAVDLGTPGPDNSFGYGRLDLTAAYDWVVLNASNPPPPPPPPVDTTGPDTSAVSASPNPNNGALNFNANTPAVRVTATVTDPVSSGGPSNVSAAEVFIDSMGSNGSGLPILASDGAFDSPAEAGYADIPLTTIAPLSEGSHNLYMHGQDLAGNWGATASVTLIIDKTSPAVSNVSSTLTNTTVNLTATATDPAPGGIAVAEWFEGVDPGVGLGNPMSVSVSTLSASINAGAWSSGNHALFVRARDNAGNWSAAVSANANVPPPNAIFADSFESGNLTAWNGGLTGTRISVNTAAKMTATGTYGMQATFGSGTAPGYLTDLTPTLESSYHVRFYFNPHGALPGGLVTIFSGLNAANTTIFQVQFQRSGSTYQVRGAVLRTGGTTTSNWFTIANNTAHPIEIAWQSGTAASFQVYTDGTLKQTLSSLNTSAYKLETVRLGPSAGLVSTVSGSLYFDAFASTRNTVIGP